MDKDLFEYEMKRVGYRTPEERAKAMGISLSAYYRRVSNECECNKEIICRVAELVGWEAAHSIFFGN